MGRTGGDGCEESLSRRRFAVRVEEMSVVPALVSEPATAATAAAAAGVPVRPELLAPAGDWECAKAAVENGADAIYFGLEKFNARMRANNFTAADLPRLMEFLHRRGVRGYVTFNTLVFQDELAAAGEYLRAIIAAGVDAAIVQDAGICRLIRELSPDFPIHASTQMTVTSPAGVEFARRLGCELVVLARECSIAEIEKIRAAVAAGPGMPLEVFVHGALCVAYSGQCLTSESLGGRSANRGECAQACRLPYELISDGQPVALGDRKYLLSPQDLAGLDVLPELVRAGVASLKIEGRLKAPEYVASITRVYRQALDEICGSRPAAKVAVPAERRYEVEMTFSRGLFTGWFAGNDNRRLVHARFGKKRGVFLGDIQRVTRDSVVLAPVAPLKPGDGVVFDAGKPEDREEGGRIYQVLPVASSKTGQPAWVELRFGQGDVNFARLRAGDKVWKTSDPELDKRLRQTFAGDAPKFTRPVTAEVHGRAGQPLTLILADENGRTVKAVSAGPLAPADNQPLTEEKLRGQLGRLGGTPYHLAGLKNFLEGQVLLPVSELNRLRREAVAELDRLRAEPLRWTLRPPAESVPESASASVTVTPAAPHLIVLVRNLAQLEAALRAGSTTVYCEFEDPKKYREAVTLFRQTLGCRVHEAGPAGEAPSIWLAPPRIFKPGEEWILNQVRSAQPDGYLVRNHEHLAAFAADRRTGDFSLNVANRRTAEHLKQSYGLERLTASYDLNQVQLAALLRATPPEWLEITVHQHMPMFHMEHCVFCAFLSKGKDYHDCGRPCDRHEVRLRDRVGAEHPLKADAGCRNTLFNSQAQTGAEYLELFRSLGARHFRVEFLNETPEEVVRVLGKYRQLLRGEITGTQLWRELKLFNQLGVTRGQMAG